MNILKSITQNVMIMFGIWLYVWDVAPFWVSVIGVCVSIAGLDWKISAALRGNDKKNAEITRTRRWLS